MKHYHSEVLDQAIRNGNAEWNKLDFFATFNQIRKRTFTESNVKNAFKNTGLVPFNPKMVINKVLTMQQSKQRPTTPPEAAPWWTRSNHLFKSPKTPKGLLREARRIQKALPGDGSLQAFIRGAIINAHSLQLGNRDLKRVHEHSIAKAARSKLKGTVAAKFGVITANQIRAQVAKRKETEEEKIQLQMRKLDASLLKEQQKAGI